MNCLNNEDTQNAKKLPFPVFDVLQMPQSVHKPISRSRDLEKRLLAQLESDWGGSLVYLDTDTTHRNLLFCSVLTKAFENN